MKNKQVIEELITELSKHSSTLNWIMRSSQNTPENNVIDSFLIHRQIEISDLITLLKDKGKITNKSCKAFIKELEAKKLFKTL